MFPTESVNKRRTEAEVTDVRDFCLSSFFITLSNRILRTADSFVHTEDRNLMLFALVHDVDLEPSWLRPRRVRVVRLPFLRPPLPLATANLPFIRFFLVSVVYQSSFPFAEFRLCGLNSHMVWKMHCDVAVKYGEAVTEKSVNDKV